MALRADTATAPPAADAPTTLTPSVSAAQFMLAIALSIVLLALHALAPAVSVAAGLALFVLGVPHGAVERVRVDNQGSAETRHAVPSLAYTALYLTVAGAVLAVWLAAPLPALALFLTVSAVHFGLSEPILRSAGLWVVAGSLVLWTGPTLDVFAQITGNASVADWAAPARGLGLAAGALLLLEAARKGDLAFAFMLLALFAVLPPVQAVAVYYFAVHSVREWRVVGRERGSLRAALRLYAPFAAPVILGGAATVAGVALGWIPLPLAAGLGVAVATPHMGPVDRWAQATRRLWQARNPRRTAH